MSQVTVPGGGEILGDNKRTKRIVVVNVGPTVEIPNHPGRLVAASATHEPGGITRGTFDFVTSDFSPGGELTSNKTQMLEIMGGSREVPVQTHPKFANIDPQRIKQITRAVENEVASAEMPTDLTSDEQNLISLLRREIKYYLVPAVTGRVTTIESNLPSLNELTTLGGESALPSPGPGRNWIMTGISAREVGEEFEVTREYTVTGDGAEAASFLYDS